MRIALLDDYLNLALPATDWSPVSDVATVITFSDHVDDQEELIRRLQGFEIVVLMRERTAFGAGMFEALPQLQLLVTTGMANAVIDLAAAADCGVTVCGTGGRMESTVELTWGLILGLVRHLPAESASIRAGGWQASIGSELHGKNLGVVGLGRIGSRVAQVGRAFGMSILAWSENLTHERAEESGAIRVTKSQLFDESDVVTLHLVLSERSWGTVGLSELGAMKPDAYLVNTSRGPIVDETALVDALRRGAISGAALDVFGREPLGLEHPFRTLPNVMATPHIGYVTREMYELFYREVVENIRSFLDGTPIRELTP